MSEYFEVEKISAVRKGLAHVFWKGYAASESTWEPLAEVAHTAAYDEYKARKVANMNKAREAKFKVEAEKGEEQSEEKEERASVAATPKTEDIEEEEQEEHKSIFMMAAMVLSSLF